MSCWRGRAIEGIYDVQVDAGGDISCCAQRFHFWMPPLQEDYDKVPRSRFVIDDHSTDFGYHAVKE